MSLQEKQTKGAACLHSKKRTLRRLPGSVALMLKPRMTGLRSVCWLLRLQEHRDMSRRGRPPPENLYPHGIWQMLTAQGGVVLLVPTDRGQVGATCCAIPRTAACNKGLSVTPCRRVLELGT